MLRALWWDLTLSLESRTMTPDQIAVLGKIFIDQLEAKIDSLPEGDEKATATHHAVRIHHHMSKLLEMGHGRGDVVMMSPIDKPPV